MSGRKEQPTQDHDAEVASEAPFYEDLDEAHPQTTRSCCTLWTLGLMLVGILLVGLWVIL